MEFSYENQGANTYLVYEIKSGETVDTLSLGMLTNNSIPGLAKTLFTQMDEEKYIKYNVSAKISMKQFFGGVVNRKRLLGAFEGIVDGLMSAEDYMIDMSCVILEPEYIFVDVTTCVATLICLPITNNEISKPDLGAFFKNIMVNTQFDQTENCDYVARIFNYLNSTPVFTLFDFKKMLDELKQTGSAAAAQPVISQPVVMTPPKQPTAPAPKTFAAPRPKAVPTPQPNAVPIPPVQPVAARPQPNVQFAVPMQNSVQAQPAAKPQSTATAEPEQKMSMFYLLQHYNKENKALYEQQKAAKKAGKSERSAAHASQQNGAPAANPGFAVPGMSQVPNTPNFAIPGRSAPVVQQSMPAKPPVQPVANRPAPAYSYQTTSQPVAQPAYQPAPQPISVKPPVRQEVYTSVASQGQSMNFGETTVLGNGAIGETTVLGSVQQTQIITPHLIRGKNKEKIMLNKPVFRIGKEKSYVDYFIGDNTAVSRSHANIITRDKTYFIVDTNSTNHTFVNGKMIQSNMETEIHHGDKIRLGNEDFEFKLY